MHEINDGQRAILNGLAVSARSERIFFVLQNPNLLVMVLVGNVSEESARRIFLRAELDVAS